MKIVSWNCILGLGNKENMESMKHLIKSEKPQIILIEETKMKDSLILQKSNYV
jgi:exonuclease III